MTSNPYFPAGKAGHIAVFDNAVPRDLCELLTNGIMSNRSKLLSPGRTGAGVMPLMKRSWDISLKPNEYWDKIGGYPDELINVEQQIARHLSICVALYEQQYPEIVQERGWRDTGFQFQWYPRGEGFYRRHIDGNPGAESSRIMAVIIYLNTVDIGGETDFPEHGVKVSPEIGRVCIFPATWTHPHACLVSISGDKMIISTFLGVDMALDI